MYCRCRRGTGGVAGCGGEGQGEVEARRIGTLVATARACPSLPGRSAHGRPVIHAE